MSDERKHHEFGPSKWPSLHVCSGYAAGGGTSEAAARGTRIHSYWEDLGKGRTEFPEDINPDEFVAASWAAGLIDALSGDNHVEWEQFVESKAPEYFGHLDVLWTTDNGATVNICDGKSGQPGEHQWIQIVGYAHAYMLSHPECTLCIGRFLYWDTRSLKEFHFTREEVLNTVNELQKWIQTGERHIGPQCTYCSAWNGCDQIKGAMFRGWMAADSGEDLYRTPEEMGELKKDLDVIAMLKKRVDKDIKGMLEAETDVPGYKLQQRSGAAKLDPVHGWTHLKGHLSAEDFLSCCKPDIKKLDAMMEMRTGQKMPEGLVEKGPTIYALKKA